MGKQWKQWLTLFLGAPKSLQMVTAAMKLKDTPWKKSYDRILKNRDITLPTKICQVKAVVFPVVMYGPLAYKESWVPKNWCFRTVVLEKTFERSNQSILKEISPECLLEGLMLKLKLQYFGHLMWRTDSSEKPLMLGKIEGRWRRGQLRMRWLDGITDSMNMSLN